MSRNERKNIFCDPRAQQNSPDNRDEWDISRETALQLAVNALGQYNQDSENEDCDEEGSYSPQVLDTPNPDEKLVSISVPSWEAYLRDRHGYNFNLALGQYNNTFHSAHSIPYENVAKIKSLLLYQGVVTSHQDDVSLCDFYNTITNKNLQYNYLPRIWDVATDLQLDFSRVITSQIREEDKTMYILRPARSSNDKSPWYVAVNSATAVLLVYRSGWTTMFEIARHFLQQGIPFHTVVESSIPPSTYLQEQPRALGTRSKGTDILLSDYNGYKLCRHDILTSPIGRAVLLQGGLVGRIAAEVVPEIRVLEGPFLRDFVVARDRRTGKYFLDDFVSPEILDCISGVYHMINEEDTNTAHLSYWPKHHIFLTSGLFSDQWSPKAEKWYRNRLQSLEDGKLELFTSAKWKSYIKYTKSDTAKYIGGSERVAEDFLRSSRRANPNSN